MKGKTKSITTVEGLAVSPLLLHIAEHIKRGEDISDGHVGGNNLALQKQQSILPEFISDWHFSSKS